MLLAICTKNQSVACSCKYAGRRFNDTLSLLLLPIPCSDGMLCVLSREAGVRNLKKHLEKIYRKVALKLVKQGAGPPPHAASQEENPVSQEAFHISGAHLYENER